MSTTRDARKDQAENCMNCIVRNELLPLVGAVDIWWSCWALQYRVTVTHDAHSNLHDCDTPSADRDTPGSTAHNGSHASTVHPAQYPRGEQIEPLGPGERPLQGNHAVPDWDTRSAPHSGIHAAGVPTAVREFRPSCPPVIMAHASVDGRIFSERFAERSTSSIARTASSTRPASVRRRARRFRPMCNPDATL